MNTEDPFKCVVCTQPIPKTRKKDAVTCSPECSLERAKMLRMKKDAHHCPACKRPSTPEERAKFAAWRRWQEELERDPDAPAPRRRGRPLGSKNKKGAEGE